LEELKELRHLRFGGVKELKELSLPAVAEELRQQLFSYISNNKAFVLTP